MSGAQPEMRQSGGGGVVSHTHEAETDSRVFVNGIRLPVGDVDIHVRKEGPTDLSRYVEVNFASPFRGEDYTSLFDGLRPNSQDNFDTAKIELKDAVTGDYYLAFHGLITGVGNAPSGPEKEWQFRAQGPSFFFDKIPASYKFSSLDGESLLEYLATELNDHLPYSISLDSTAEVESDDTLEIPYGLEPNVGGQDAPETVSVEMPTSKSFQANKHSLADVVNYFTEKAGVHLWLNPTDRGARIVTTENPTAQSHQAHYQDGNVAVVNNDAYAELTPANTIVLKGDAKKSQSSVGIFNRHEKEEQFTSVKARHQPLYERAGNTELHAEPNELSEADSVSEMENEAKKRLKKHIDETTGGDMQTMLAAPVKPFDTIEALPACNENVARGLDPIRYEVSRVHHEVKASGISQTTLNVGIETAMDNIEIVKTWESEV